MSAGLEHLAVRTLLVGFDGSEPPGWVRAVATEVGGIVLYGHNLGVDGPQGAARIATAFGDGVLLAADEEGGDVTRLHYGTGSPTPGNHVLGAADDPDTTLAVAGSIGAELRAAGIRLNLAPDADVNSNPGNPVIGVRSFGADPELVARHTAAYVTGLQAQGVAACAKHFPGHGDTDVDSHLALPTVGGSEADWRRIHLPPFAAAVRAGVRAVMTAHILVPALDPGVPATLSRRILTGLLRDELGFDGVVITDALEMWAIAAGVGSAPAAPLALAAGADLLCLGGRDGEPTFRKALAAVVDAVRAGELALARLEDAAARVDALHEGVVKLGADPVAGVVTDGWAAGLAAAGRAVCAAGLPPLAGPPVLIELRAEPNIAVGAAGWDIAGPLTERGFPPARTVRVTGVGAALRSALVGSTGRPVLVVGRDVPRHLWQREVWAAARAARPDAVLVDLGLPRPVDVRVDLCADRYVLAGGAARPNLTVAADTLVAGCGNGRRR